MSLILTQWLNDIGLVKQSLHPSDLERTFSSGYQFGKLLQSLGLQDDFDTTFINATTVDALLKNYISLEATMRVKLDFRMTSLMALDLIHEKNGATAKLLYQIKVTSDAMPRRRPITHIGGRKEEFDSYPSSPVGNSP